jgi:hypothetical protein
VPRIYLEVEQFNPLTNERLRLLQHELPDHLNIDNGLVEGTYRAWVSYPDWYGEDKARSAVKETLAKMDVTGIAAAE